MFKLEWLSDPLFQALKFQLFELAQDDLTIVAPAAHINVGLKRSVAPYRRELPGQMQHVQIRLDLRADRLRYCIQVGEQSLDGAMLLNKLMRRLLSDASYARVIVASIAHQPFHVDHLARRQLAFLQQYSRSVDHIIADPFLHNRNRDAIVHQLKQVVIASHNRDIRLVLEHMGQRSDTIVGLITINTDIRHTEAGHHLFHQIELRDEVLRRGRPVRFVAVVIYPFIGKINSVVLTGP